MSGQKGGNGKVMCTVLGSSGRNVRMKGSMKGHTNIRGEIWGILKGNTKGTINQLSYTVDAHTRLFLHVHGVKLF